MIGLPTNVVINDIMVDIMFSRLEQYVLVLLHHSSILGFVRVVSMLLGFYQTRISEVV